MIGWGTLLPLGFDNLFLPVLGDERPFNGLFLSDLMWFYLEFLCLNSRSEFESVDIVFSLLLIDRSMATCGMYSDFTIISG